MKLLLVLLFSPILPPPWPEINFTSCPRMSQPLDSSQRTWKYGQAERDKYAAVAQMLQEKKYSTAASAAAKFVTEYPDSDFHDPSLFLEMTALAFLDDRVGQARVAEQMVRFPLAEPVFRELGFVELAGTLSPYVFRDDPAKERKLTDLESWIRCAQEAESANVRTSSVSQDAF